MQAVKNLLKKLFCVCILGVPIVGFAAGIPAVDSLVNKIGAFILKPLIFGMFAIATLVFMWGVKNFVGAADDAEARSKGAQQMIWGIVGMAIMIGAVALVTIIGNTATKL